MYSEGICEGDFMAINDWKSFLMPYEQAVEELKVNKNL